MGQFVEALMAVDGVHRETVLTSAPVGQLIMPEGLPSVSVGSIGSSDPVLAELLFEARRTNELLLQIAGLIVSGGRLYGGSVEGKPRGAI